MKFFNKKGVSPIIASVLLVVITIAIGATTMAFIRSLTDTNLQKAQEGTSKIACGSDVKLEITMVNDNYKLCYDNSTGAMDILLHNTGSVDVKGFVMTMILNNGSVVATDFNTGYEVNQNAYASLNMTPSSFVNDASSNVAQWRIEPKIRIDAGKDMTVCTDSAIVKDNKDVSPCQ